MLATLYYHQKCMRIPIPPHHCQLVFYYFIYPDRSGLICFMLHVSNQCFFFFFMCILVIFTSILRKCLFLSSAHFLNWVVFVLCLLFFIQSGCYSDNRCKSLILWLLFHFLEHVLCRTIYFISDEVQFIFYSVCFCFGDHI